MAVTYEPVVTATLGSAATELTVSNIPQTYTDLVVDVFVPPVPVATNIAMYINDNSSGSTECGFVTLFSNGSGVGSQRSYQHPYFAMNYAATANTTYPTAYTLHFFQYARTDVRKSVIIMSSLDYAGSGASELREGMRNNNEAITKLRLNASGQNLPVGTRVSIFGIAKA